MNANGNQSKLKTWHKCLLASIGASMPLLMSLYYAEWEIFVQKFSLAIFLGYSIKVIILIIAGALIGYFYRLETSAMKLFQLGIAAPSIILGLINGQSLGQPSGNDIDLNHVSFMSYSIPKHSLSGGILYAYRDQATETQEVKVYHYDYPEETSKQELLRGFSGKKMTNTWFLIYDSLSDLQKAEAITNDLQNRYSDLEVRIFQSVRDPAKYDLVIGVHLEYKEGLMLQKKYSSLLDKNIELWEYIQAIYNK